MKTKRFLLNIAPLILFATLAGCCTFCDEVRRCGEGTWKNRQGDDMECLPEWNTVCADGTKLDVKREHVPSNDQGEGGVGGERECIPETDPEPDDRS